MRGLLEAHHALLTHDVLHEVVQLPHGVNDYDELPAILGLPAEVCIGVRIYVADGVAGRNIADDAVVGLVVPAGSRLLPVDLARVRPDKQWRPARPEETNALTDHQAGLVCPFGLPATIPLLADHSIARAGVLYCATGESGTAIGIHARDLLRVTSVRLVALLAPDIPDIPHWITPAVPRA
jgi:prolyl-tRNA editing enzyme YbaK/EbsC (Cys-tRNA(Pro) deacylase)